MGRPVSDTRKPTVSDSLHDTLTDQFDSVRYVINYSTTHYDDPAAGKRFNPLVDGEPVGDLCGVYEVLVGGDASAMDPFAERGEAVTAFEKGDFAAMCLHNVADIRRAVSLDEVAERYCSKSDIPIKSLTSVIHDK